MARNYEALSSLTMRFFYVPGNHDLRDQVLKNAWRRNFGPDHYYFIYKNVLFLIVNTAESITDDQIHYFSNVLKHNKKVLWTFVFTHRPQWNKGNCKNSAAWERFESSLSGRNYTVFAGHRHAYNKCVINGRNHYILATTGGLSELKGPEYGQIDLITWVTLTESGPIIANISPDCVFDDNLVR